MYGLLQWQGGENGNKNDAPPFQNLEDAAEIEDESVAEFCDGVRPGNGNEQSQAPALGPHGN